MSAVTGRTPFVGREQELALLTAAFDAAARGTGGLAMVVGEPGIGKTALCERLAAHAADQGGRVLTGYCYEEGSLSLPYLPSSRRCVRMCSTARRSNCVESWEMALLTWRGSCRSCVHG